MTWEPPATLDPECLWLCTALNALPGIETRESCCGHGKDPFQIWFTASEAGLGLQILSRALCPRYYNDSFRPVPGEPGRFNTPWKVTLDHSDVAPFAGFLLEGPVGDFESANELGEELTELLRSPERESMRNLFSNFFPSQEEDIDDEEKKVKQATQDICDTLARAHRDVRLTPYEAMAAAYAALQLQTTVIMIRNPDPNSEVITAATALAKKIAREGAIDILKTAMDRARAS